MIQLMIDTHLALHDHHALRLEVLQVLATQADDNDKLTLSIVKQVVRLGPTAKVCGIKLIRTATQLGLKESKNLWEIGAILQNYNLTGRAVTEDQAREQANSQQNSKKSLACPQVYWTMRKS